MTLVTAAELVTLRKRPHQTQLRLAIYMPDVLFGARVNNATAAMGDITIPYDGVYTGVYTDVKVGMTLYYFTYSGPLINGSPVRGRQGAVGRLRVRSITAAQVVVAENSLPWADNEWIEIVRFVEPWAVYPRQVVTSSNVPTWYKDYDIAYSDQNEVFDPVVVMGPNRAIALIAPFTNAAHCVGTASLYFDGSKSYDLNTGATLTAYQWNYYQDGQATVTYNVMTPGNVLFTTAGNYAVSLTVTNSLGKTATSWRFIVIHNPLDATCSGADRLKPIRKWGTSSLTGNYQSGGWEGKIWFREAVGLETIVDGALVIIYALDDWDEVTGVDSGYIGGSYSNVGNIVFNGYIRDGSVELSPDGSSVVSVGVTDLAGRLDKLEGFGVSIKSVTDPGAVVSVTPAWSQVEQMTIDIALYHYIRWHTTIYSMADVRKNGDTRYVEYADFDKGSLYGAIDRFLLSTILAHLCVNAQGEVWMETKVDVIPVGSRTLGTIMTLTDSDWRDKLAIVSRVETDTSYVEIGGFAYAGPTTDVATPFISAAPSQVPGYEGKQVVLNGLVLTDQTVTSQLAGDIYTSLNKLYPSVTVPMSGNYRIFDIAPQERLLITLAQGDTNLEISWSAKKFIPRQVTYNINNPSQVLLVDVVCEEETDGEPGVAGPYPPEEPPGCEGADCDPPPPCTDCDPPPCTDCNTVGDSNTVYVMTSRHLARSRNFLTAPPTWNPVDTGLAGTLRDFILEPYNPAHEAWCITTSGLYHTDDLNETTPTWTLLLTRAAFVALNADWDDTSNTPAGPWCVRRSIADPDYVIMMQEIGYTPAVGDKRRMAIAHSHDKGATWHGTVTCTDKSGNLLNGTLIVSQYAINKVWAGSGGFGAPVLQKSSDHGHTLSADVLAGAAGDPITTMDVAYDGTAAADGIIYVGANRTNPSILRNPNGGSVGTWVDVSPTYLGNKYGATQFGGMIQTNGQQKVWAIATDNSGGTNTDISPHRFFKSTDGGSNWTYVGDMPILANGEYGSLGQWPYNDDWMFCIFEEYTPSVGDNIYFSQNGGASWSSKLGNWTSAVDASLLDMWTKGPGWHLIVPVWVAI